MIIIMVIMNINMIIIMIIAIINTKISDAGNKSSLDSSEDKIGIHDNIPIYFKIMYPLSVLATRAPWTHLRIK